MLSKVQSWFPCKASVLKSLITINLSNVTGLKLFGYIENTILIVNVAPLCGGIETRYTTCQSTGLRVAPRAGRGLNMFHIEISKNLSTWCRIFWFGEAILVEEGNEIASSLSLH